MAHVDPAHEAEELPGANQGNSAGTPASGNGSLTTIETHLPAVPAMGWSYGPPQRPEILSAKANPVELFHAVRRRWPLAIGLGLTTGIVLAALVWFLVPVKYEVYALLRVAGKQQSVLSKTGSGTEEFQTFKRTQVQLILSPFVLKKATAEPSIAKLPTILEHNEDPSAWLKGELIIDYPDDSEILRVAIKGKRSADLTKIVDMVVKMYLKEIVQNERDKRIRHEAELNKAYEDYQKELAKQMESLHQMEVVSKATTTEAAQIARKLALDKLQAAMSQRDRLMFAKEEVETDIAVAKAREENPEQSTTADYAIDLEMNKDPIIFNMSQKLADMHEMLALEKQMVPDPTKSVRVRRRQQAIYDMQEKLEETKATLRPKLIEMKKAEEEKKDNTLVHNLSLPVLEAKRKNIDERMEEVKKVIAEEGEIVTNMETFSANVASKQESLRTIKGIASELGGDLERSRLERLAMDRIVKIDDAILDSPRGDAIRKYVGVVFAFILGCGLVTLGIAFLEFNRRRVNGAGQVNDGLGIRVIGELPSVSGRAWRRVKGGRGAAVLKALMAERIDGTRTSLIHTTVVDPPRVVMVTSAEPHEGKTTAATQLAASLARSGRRTVLVDADIRNPGAHLVFDMPVEPGLSELLRGEAERDSVVHPTRTPNLWLLPAGRCDLRSVQALSTSYLASAISALCVQFDYVIIDAGPVLKVADPLMVGQHVDAAIISVLRDVSQIPKVYEACERLRAVGITVLGSVVNGVNDDVARHGVELLMAETG
jgi:polysaccharide biosynthesis transport protein